MDTFVFFAEVGSGLGIAETFTNIVYMIVGMIVSVMTYRLMRKGDNDKPFQHTPEKISVNARSSDEKRRNDNGLVPQTSKSTIFGKFMRLWKSNKKDSDEKRDSQCDTNNTKQRRFDFRLSVPGFRISISFLFGVLIAVTLVFSGEVNRSVIKQRHGFSRDRVISMMETRENEIQKQVEIMNGKIEEAAAMYLAANVELEKVETIASKLLAEQERKQAEAAAAAAKKKIEDANRALAEAKQKQEEAERKNVAALKALQAEKDKQKSGNFFDSLIPKKLAFPKLF
jgi:F0F1-type ATP synthase membrane subunit b/b'